MKQGATWRKYEETYNNFLVSVSQTRLTTFVSAESLKNFPKHLPPKLRSSLVKDITKFVRNSEKFMATKGSRRVTTEIESKITPDALVMSMALVKSGLPTNKIDFERLLHYQELVMILAHMDAFMVDTLRIICTMHPEVLESDKKIDWSAILACGGWTKLLEQMAEQCVLEFGLQPINNRMEFLRGRRVGLELGSLSSGHIEQLVKAEYARHIIVHNGGKSSREYVKKTKRNDLKLGEFVPVERQFLDEVYGMALILVIDIFTEVSEKFFGIKGGPKFKPLSDPGASDDKSSRA